MNAIDITSKHGKEMYIIALEHAIRMFELVGEDALPKLKERIAEVQKEVEELNK